MNIRPTLTKIAGIAIVLSFVIWLAYHTYLEDKANKRWHDEYLADTTTTAEFATDRFNNEKSHFIVETPLKKLEGVDLWRVKWSYSQRTGHKVYDSAVTTDKTLKPGGPIKIRWLLTYNDYAGGDWDNTRRIPIVIRAEAVTPPPQPAEKP